MSPGSENWRRTCPAMFRKLSIPRPCDIDDQPAFRECAILLGPLSSASPDSSRRFLHALPSCRKRIAPDRAERRHIGVANTIKYANQKSGEITGKYLLRVHTAGLAFPAGARTDHEVMRAADNRFDQRRNKFAGHRFHRHREKRSNRIQRKPPPRLPHKRDRIRAAPKRLGLLRFWRVPPFDPRCHYQQR